MAVRRARGAHQGESSLRGARDHGNADHVRQPRLSGLDRGRDDRHERSIAMRRPGGTMVGDLDGRSGMDGIGWIGFVTIDCADPDRLAAWWGDLLGLKVGRAVNRTSKEEVAEELDI